MPGMICSKCGKPVMNMYPGKYFCPEHGITWTVKEGKGDNKGKVRPT